MTNTVAMKVSVDGGPPVVLKGRVAWCLDELVQAGGNGVTPVDRPAPRWSGYVDRLRDEFGVAIETVRERHGGAFAGQHGRYLLRSSVEILERVTA